MLTDEVDRLLQALKKGENFDLDHIEQGRVFLRRLAFDSAKFRKLITDHDMPLDKRGWLDAELFPLTVDIFNREPSPGDKVYVGHGRTKVCVVYYGVSPELENFVALCLWPGDSKTSKVAYKKIYEIVQGDRQFTQVIRFRHGFGLEPPNLIHPFNDRSIDAITKPRSIYEWQYVPYLRELGNTILSHKSPLNFQKVFLESASGRSPMYINAKSSIGSPVEVRRNEASIRVPCLFRNDLIYRTKLTPEVFAQLKNAVKGTSYHFLVYECAEENIAPTVFKVTEAPHVEVAATLLIVALYTLFLGSRRLLALPNERFLRLLEICVEHALRFCGAEQRGAFQLWTPENFFAIYVSPFFRKVGPELLYVPIFLSNLSDHILKLCDSSLSDSKQSLSGGGPLFGSDGAWLNKAIVGRQYQALRFLIDTKRFIWWSDEHQLLYQVINRALS